MGGEKGGRRCRGSRKGGAGAVEAICKVCTGGEEDGRYKRTFQGRQYEPTGWTSPDGSVESTHDEEDGSKEKIVAQIFCKLVRSVLSCLALFPPSSQFFMCSYLVCCHRSFLSGFKC